MTSEEKAKMTTEAAAIMIELSSGKDGKKKQRPEAKRARKSEKRVYDLEREGSCTQSTNPLLLDGFLRKYGTQGKTFQEYLFKEGILKNKYGNYDDNLTKENPLPPHGYESVLFYSEESLEAVYPDKKITGLEVLENGKQNRPFKDIIKYADIPNAFLSNMRIDLIRLIKTKRNFIGVLDHENKKRKKQGETFITVEEKGENIPEEKAGELRNHLCCLFFIFLFHSIENSFILRFWS